MKKLFLDIETSPTVAYVWRIYDENIGVDQIIEPTRVICFAYAFDDGPVAFASEWTTNHEDMVKLAHALLDEADAVVHYNGSSFDEPHLAREFLEYGLSPPSRPQAIDLYRTIKNRFKFVSNKLVHVADQLSLREGKLKTDFELWRKVLADDVPSQLEMQDYNMEDVELTRDLYKEILPWIDKHPNAALYEEGEEKRCTRCGSTDLTLNGIRRTNAGNFQRYACRSCGGASRGMKRLSTTSLREA